MSKKNETTEITFSEAYAELKSITDTLNGEEVEADQLVDLLRRGKGLEAALREHLTGIEQEVEAIENGDGIAAFKIVAAETGDPEEDADVPADTSDFEGAAVSSGDGKDDIPF